MSNRELLPIPPIASATDPIHSAADMRQRWRALMGELGFGERLLWVGFVGADRRMYKTMSQVPIGYRPKPGIIEFVMSRLPLVLAGLDAETTVALLLTRPGFGALSDADRRWAAALVEAAERFAVPIEPIFRANDHAVVVINPAADSAARCSVSSLRVDQVAVRRGIGCEHLDAHVRRCHPGEQPVVVFG